MDINELESYRLSDAVKFNDRLNPRIFDQHERMRPEVRDRLLEIADDFREFLGVKDINVRDITVSGSNAAYTYTPHSDIDLHLVVDMNGTSDVYRELFDAKKYQYNDQHDIKIGGYDVELYVQDADQPHHSQGIYSLINDDWVNVPRRRKADVNDISVRNKYQDVGHRIETAIDSGDFDVITDMIKKIKEMRSAGLAQHGEFGPENLAFKLLRAQGLIKKLHDARNAAKDRMFSMDEARRQRPVVYGFASDVDENINTVDSLGNQDPTGPETPPKMPKGTVNVEVSDVYDWYKLGQDISNLDHADPREYGQGAPETVLAFGSEPIEHKYIQQLGRLGLKTHDIDESAESIQSFADYCKKFLGIKTMPEISINDSLSDENQTFGRFDPETNTIELQVAGRHPADVMRTLAHELVHYHQQQRDGGLPAGAGETGSDHENEANARAGEIMRDFGKKNPDVYDSDDIEEAAYPGNLGAMEMFKFFDIADDRQKQLMKKLLAAGKKDLAWKFLQKVTGVSLHPLNEAGGYIPVNDREARDPRFMMAITQDIRPGEVQRQAAKMGFKTDPAGVPPLLMKNLRNKLEEIKTK